MLFSKNLEAPDCEPFKSSHELKRILPRSTVIIADAKSIAHQVKKIKVHERNISDRGALERDFTETLNEMVSR